MVSLDDFRQMIGNIDDSDELLCIILDEARDLILAYTNRKISQWITTFDGAQLQLGLVLYNRLGVEGLSNRSEGVVSSAFSSIPETFKHVLDLYRMVNLR